MQERSRVFHRRWTAVLLVLVVLALAAGPRGHPVHAQDGGQLAVTQYTLGNGLEVLLVEDHSAPTVAISVWYRVGGADDPPGRSGFAHLFEHMMFQGSAHVAPGQHAEWITAAGGLWNATTGIDRTNYYEALPSNQLPLALWLEAERMASLVVDEDNFQREREVVKEEYRQRIENQPYGAAILALQTLPYDFPPYQRPVIGSIEDLDAASVEEVRDFHRAYYKPNNAVLAVAGDINLAQTQEMIQRYFGGIARQEPAPTLSPYTFSIQEEAQELAIQDPLARLPATLIGYRIPPRSHPDYYALEVLARILGVGNSSRLAQALLDSGQAVQASAGIQGNVGPSLFTVILVPNQGVAAQHLEEVYYGELERLGTQGVEEDELTKAANQTLAQKLRSLETAFGLAESVQATNFYLGDPEAVLMELDRYRAITSDDIRAVVENYLQASSRNIIRVEPAGPSSGG